MSVGFCPDQETRWQSLRTVNLHTHPLMLAASLLLLAGCGSGSKPSSSGGFAGIASSHGNVVVGGALQNNSVASVRLNPASVVGGAPAEITVRIAQPAPTGGVKVSLSSSEPDLVRIPSSVEIAEGETRGRFKFQAQR